MEKLETAATKPNVNIRDMFDSDRQEYFECFTEFPDLKERFTNCAIRIARVEESLSGGPD